MCSKRILGQLISDSEKTQQKLLSMKFLLLPFLALASAGSRVVMEPEVSVGSSQGWSKVVKSLDGEMVNLIVMMKHQPDKMAELEETFWAVSDPKHERYGQHLSRDTVQLLLAPPTGTTERVVSWLHSMGGMNITHPNIDMINIELDVATAETMLATTFYNFVHKSNKHTITRATQQYSLPADISDVIQIVGNVLQFPRIDSPIIVKQDAGAAANVNADWPESCNNKCKDFVTPAVLAARYSTGPAPTTAAKGNSMGTSEFQGQGYTQTDLNLFASTCSLQNMTVDRDVGNSPHKAGVEAELDIEYINALGGAIPLTNVYSEEYSLVNWAKALAALENPPPVMSVSYGNDEAQQTGIDYMDAANVQFKALGVRGVSVLFASGDQGVYGREGAGFFKKSPFHPDFPAGSPYITVVGGTDFANKSTIGDEMAWSAGGGGFSNTFGIPSYQADAVSGYKTNFDMPPANLWNSTGRGYPDIAALGGQVNSYCVVVNGEYKGVAGTSAACPVAAAIFSLVNDALLSAGKPALGFLNPFIYQNGAAFNDVTIGSNPGAGPYGFSAEKGWDAATGFGTPDFMKLKAAALANWNIHEKASS